MPLAQLLRRSDLGETTRARLLGLNAAIAARSVADCVKGIAECDEPFVREAALTHLVRLGGDFPGLVLAALMRSHDTPLRNAAIETLGNLGEAAVDALEPLLKDADVDLRIYALTALERTFSLRAAEVALQIALHDEDVNVCAAAVDVVAQSGAREMSAALETIAQRFPERPFLAFAARAAQHAIG